MSLLTRVLRKLKKEAGALFGPRVRSVGGISERRFLRLFDSDSCDNESTAALLRHFDQRTASNWPEIPDQLTDLRIDLSRMRDQEIIEKADAALDGDIHPSGIQPVMTKRGDIDWTSNPSDSREWLLMIHRHAWWPLWGAAYQRTGDEKYARAFVSQLLDWIDKNPLQAQKSEHVESWRLMETGLRMRISWISSFGCFYRSKAFTDVAKLKMLRAIYDHGQFLNRFSTNRNHLLRESNGLLSVGLCFDEFTTSSNWVESAVRRISGELRSQVNTDGSHLEMSVGYQWLTVVEFEVTHGMLQRFHRSSLISGLDGTLRKMYDFLACVIRPDLSFPQLNDGFILWDARNLEKVGRERGWSDVEYIASAGASGQEPTFCSRSFPNAGFHIMRSDWQPDARYLVADTGPHGGPHGHEDKLSFELSAYGARFIVDSGSYTYNKDDPFRKYFVGSQGHNTVLVDQGSQVRRWDPRHYTPFVENVVHGAWYSSGELDLATGRYDEGYAPFDVSPPPGPVSRLSAAHQRDFLFIKPDYWLLADYLESDARRTYTFLFHLAPDVIVEQFDGSSAVVRSSSNGASLVIKALTDHEMRGEVIEGSESPIQGWFSEDHYRKCPSPVLSFSIDDELSATVVWLLYPLPAGSKADDIHSSIKRNSAAAQVSISVQRGLHTDRVRLPGKIAPISSDGAARLKRIARELQRGS